MFCRKCGQQIPDGMFVCGYCGTPVEQNPNGNGNQQESRQDADDGATGMGTVSLILGVSSLLLDLLGCCLTGMAIAGIVCSCVCAVFVILTLLYASVVSKTYFSEGFSLKF